MTLFRRDENAPWWASIYVKGKGRIRQSLKTRDRAEAEERHRILERIAWGESLQAAFKPPPAPAPVTLQDVYDRAIATHYTELKDQRGVQARWATLTRFIAPAMNVKDITPMVARDAFTTMRGATWTRGPLGTPHPYSTATINRCMALLGKLLKFAHMEMDGALSVVPKMPKGIEGRTPKRRAIRPDEFVRMVNALENHENPKWRACADLMRVLWGTGCRVGELMPEHFTWAQVDFANESLHWDDTKGGNPVGKPMTEDVYAVLKARSTSGLRAPFSDINQDILRYAWDWLRADVLGITDRAEQDRLVPHSIRHSAATRILRAGNSATQAQKLLGHKSYLTTQRYEHLEVDDLRGAVDSLRAPPGLKKR
ncbi:MAG: site-specific integrase [Rubrivivax sp.]|nr:MAG: site-specific integrase [Rubrivivax sp.]